MAIAPSFDDIYEIGKAELQDRRPELLVLEGDLTDAMLHGGTAMAEACLQFFSQAVRATYLDGAYRADLTRLVDDHWNIQRFPEVASQVELSFSRPTAAAGAGTLPAGTVVATGFASDGSTVEFATTVDLSFGAAALGPLTVDAVAVVEGSAGNVAAGEITRIISSIFDVTITVTNLAAAAGGANEESDVELRARARGFWATLRRGTKEALRFGALQVPTVRVSTVVEDPTGLVYVYVSDADGNSTLQMVSDVTEELEAWRCAGTVVNVIGSTPLLTSVTVQLTVTEGTDVLAMHKVLSDAVEARMAKLGAGEQLHDAMLIAALVNVDPDNILDVAFTLPVGFPVTPAVGQVIRLDVFTATEA